MKKLGLLALGIILVAGTLTGCKDNKQVNNNSDNTGNTGNFIVEDITGENDAVINYNDKLVELASNCILAEDEMWDVYDDETSTSEDIQTAIGNTVSTCSETKNQINELGDWEGDSSLKDAVITIIEKEVDYFTKFKEIQPYLEKEELNDDEKAIYDPLLEEIQAIDQELADANKNLVLVQEQFAKDHGFELEAEETVE